MILLGEHAVVYGFPALAVGIDRGARATATPIAGTRSRLEVASWGVVVSEDDSSTDLGRAFGAVLEASRRVRAASGRDAAVAVAAHAELPPGGGLGCSAALGVAVARALVPTASPAEAADLAMAWERIFHGNPSGIDAAVAASGGSVLFRRGEPMEPVRLAAPLTVCLGSTGSPSSTKAMVDGLARLRDRERGRVEAAFASIGGIVADGRRALEAGAFARLGRLMDDNQAILHDLALSTDAIAQLCTVARTAGAAGAKLTGAGGGGCVVALAGDDAVAERVVLAWKAAGFSGFAAKVDAPAGGAS